MMENKGRARMDAVWILESGCAGGGQKEPRIPRSKTAFGDCRRISNLGSRSVARALSSPPIIPLPGLGTINAQCSARVTIWWWHRNRRRDFLCHACAYGRLPATVERKAGPRNGFAIHASTVSTLSTSDILPFADPSRIPPNALNRRSSIYRQIGRCAPLNPWPVA
jgi:hypothetical protein